MTEFYYFFLVLMAIGWIACEFVTRKPASFTINVSRWFLRAIFSLGIAIAFHGLGWVYLSWFMFIVFVAVVAVLAFDTPLLRR